MKPHCRNLECAIVDTGRCTRGHADHLRCPSWEEEPKVAPGQEKANRPERGAGDEPFDEMAYFRGGYLHWNDIDHYFREAKRTVVTIVGEHQSGKTTLLGMLYLLLLNGHEIPGWRFHYCFSLKAWEALAQVKRYVPAHTVLANHARTSAQRGGQMLHLSLKSVGRAKAMNLLLPDLAGEFFTKWAAEPGKAPFEEFGKIIAATKAFILLVDCARLCGAEARVSRRNILNLMQAIIEADPDDRRPKAIVFTKYDLIHPEAQRSLNEVEELAKNWLPNAQWIHVSVELLKDEALPHAQLLPLFQWLLDKI